MSKYTRDYYMPGEFMDFDAAWTDMEEQMTLEDFSEYFGCHVSYDHLLEWAMKQENFFNEFEDYYSLAEQEYFRDYYHEVEDEEIEQVQVELQQYGVDNWGNLFQINS